MKSSQHFTKKYMRVALIVMPPFLLCWPIMSKAKSAYSPVLIPFDFYLLMVMKYGLCGEHFPSNDVTIAVVKQWVISTGADFWRCGM